LRAAPVASTAAPMSSCRQGGGGAGGTRHSLMCGKSPPSFWKTGSVAQARRGMSLVTDMTCAAQQRPSRVQAYHGAAQLPSPDQAHLHRILAGADGGRARQGAQQPAPQAAPPKGRAAVVQHTQQRACAGGGGGGGEIKWQS
jgi:hypothetical protein